MTTARKPRTKPTCSDRPDDDPAIRAEVDRLVAEFGIELLPTYVDRTRPGQSHCGRMLYRFVSVYGIDVVRMAVRCTMETAERNRMCLTQAILGALCDLFAARPSLMSLDTLDAFDEIDLQTLEKQARSLIVSEPSALVPRAVPLRPTMCTLIAFMIEVETQVRAEMAPKQADRGPPVAPDNPATMAALARAETRMPPAAKDFP